MSAFMVSNEHINVLVWAAGRDRHGSTGNAFRHTTTEAGRHLCAATTAGRKELGQMLWQGNLDSLRARYGDSETAEPYRYSQPRHLDWSPLEVLQALDCYEYQACEVRDWAASEVYEVCQALRLHYIDQATAASGSRVWAVEENSIPAALANA